MVYFSFQILFLPLEVQFEFAVFILDVFDLFLWLLAHTQCSENTCLCPWPDVSDICHSWWFFIVLSQCGLLFPVHLHVQYFFY